MNLWDKCQMLPQIHRWSYSLNTLQPKHATDKTYTDLIYALSCACIPQTSITSFLLYTEIFQKYRKLSFNYFSFVLQLLKFNFLGRKVWHKFMHYCFNNWFQFLTFLAVYADGFETIVSCARCQSVLCSSLSSEFLLMGTVYFD